MPKTRDVVILGRLVGWEVSCPACQREHLLLAGKHVFVNGDYDAPTFLPSFTFSRREPGRRAGVTVEVHRCHCEVAKGQISYLSDSTHAMRCSTQELPELLGGVEVPAGPCTCGACATCVGIG